MTSFYSRFYWRLGFQSRLYDLLTPESYAESMRQLVRHVSVRKNPVWLDAGCGSGAIINILTQGMWNGVYIGTDILLAGLISAQKIRRLKNLSNNIYLVQSDFTQSVPVKNNLVDVISAHFSLYTVDPDKRREVFREFRRLLKEGGTLAVVEPSPAYSASRIIEDSIRRVTVNKGPVIAWIKKIIVYPLTYQLGLKFIERQLNKKVWHCSEREALCTELRENGFVISHVESVYAGSATLVIAS